MEAALKALQPAPAALNRDVVMFRAGRASAGRAARIWPAATGAMTAAAAGLAMALWLQPAPGERIVYVQLPAPQVDTRPVPEQRNASPATVAVDDALSSPFNYAHLRDQVARHGIDAIPAPPSVSNDAPKPSGTSWQNWWKGDADESPGKF
jgi:hypothetical protein